MIETKRDRIKDYIIAILLVIIAVLLGVLYSKELMDKNMKDRKSSQTTTRKQITNYFESLNENGYVLNDFSTSANFDYDLGKVKLFGKDYKISIKNNHNECSPACVYMYEIRVNEKKVYTSAYLTGIKVGVIGNYVAIEEIHTSGLMQLILIRANDGYKVQSYYFDGNLNITHNEGVYNLSFKEQKCDSRLYSNTTVTYNKTNDTFEKNEQLTNESIGDNNICN